MAKLPTPEEEAEQYEFIRAVGQRVNVMRERSGLTRRQMTERANLKPAYGYLIEEGGQNLTLKTLITIAQTLGCTPRDLMPDPPAQIDSEAELQLIRERVKRTLEGFAQLETNFEQLREALKSTTPESKGAPPPKRKRSTTEP